MAYIKSPLNYTGNKVRILNQILPHFPTGLKMTDLFCGGANVGINSSFEEVTFIDSDLKVIGLLKTLAFQDPTKFLKEIEKIIETYNLSYSAKYTYFYYISKISDNRNNGLKKYNSEGYYKLREDYNSLSNKQTLKANCMLYTLMIYAFNNDIRFNSVGEFNLPVGKTDLNKVNIEKIYNFKEAVTKKKIEFIKSDFREKTTIDIVNKSDFVYMDPPYLITEAVYNKTSKWNENTENQLMQFLSYLVEIKKPFILSNVLSKSEKSNLPLSNWITNNKNQIFVYDINYHYRSSSYHKKNRNSKEKEIIVTYMGDTK